MDKIQKHYEKMMQKCLSLAKKGEGHTSPNPLVGCVITDDNFKILSTGFHKKYGTFHAERNAILNSKNNLKNAILFCNLEPCCHQGKTPPCTDLIIETGIKKVVIGLEDPNPIVKGKGIKQLKEAGIEVVEHILEDKCKELNEIFIKNQLKHQPFITIKTATTLDGKIATKTNSSKWITSDNARKEVMKIRSKYDAILTSSNTVKADNPEMTARIKNGKNPIRVVLDRTLSTDVESKIYNDNGVCVYIFTSVQEIKKEYPNNVKIIKIKEKNDCLDLREVVSKLYDEGVRSILVEAGSRLNQSFIKENLADKLILFLAPKLLGDEKGKNFVEGFDVNDINDCKKLQFIQSKALSPDIMLELNFAKTNS